MRREAARTLYTLSDRYQRDVEALDYEVLAVDNASTEPLQQGFVEGFGPGFSHHFETTDSASPCRALNAAVDRARGEYVVMMIDGARMLSPGVLASMNQARRIYPHCFVYTAVLHLGHERQNVAISNGYDQRAEDTLLGSVDWKADGYTLFDISSLGGSSRKGFLTRSSESGCFMVKKSDYLDIGGYCEAFESPGGGLANIDLFNRFQRCEHIQPIMLLGEATFHQFHGGTVTNVPEPELPWDSFKAEYEAIRSERLSGVKREPLHLGEIHARSRRFLMPEDSS